MQMHRDIKPNNVMVDNRGIFLLTDFGIVKNLDGDWSVRKHTIVGTAAFMAPEQKTGKYNEMVDIYGLALTALYFSSSEWGYKLDCKETDGKETDSKKPERAKWANTAILLRMINDDPSKRPTISTVLDDRWIRQGISISEKTAKEEMERLREENRGLSPLQSAVLQMSTLPPLVDEDRFLENVTERGGALAFSLGFGFSWNASKEEASVDCLLNGIVNMKAQLLTRILKEGGRIGKGKEGNGYYAKHALDRGRVKKKDGETEEEKKKREEENKALTNAETSRKQKWMGKAAKVAIAIRTKLADLNIDGAASFAQVHSITKKAINIAFADSESVGFQEIPDSTREFLSTLLATLHMAE